MAVKDDLISAGLSEPQAVAVNTEDTTGSNINGLVAAGFSYTQAVAMGNYDNNGRLAADLNDMVVQGLWAGTAVTAIKAALDVTP
jgi:hypothetical protein